MKCLLKVLFCAPSSENREIPFGRRRAPGSSGLGPNRAVCLRPKRGRISCFVRGLVKLCTLALYRAHGSASQCKGLLKEVLSAPFLVKRKSRWRAAKHTVHGAVAHIGRVFSARREGVCHEGVWAFAKLVNFALYGAQGKAIVVQMLTQVASFRFPSRKEGKSVDERVRGGCCVPGAKEFYPIRIVSWGDVAAQSWN